MKLYDAPQSGNCHKIRMLLSFLGLAYESVPVDSRGDGTRKPDFLRLNPRAQIPVLEDGDMIVWDSQAILTYLAREYGGDRWMPLDTVTLTRVLQWLAVSENELLFGLARARAVRLLGRPFNLEECQQLGRAGLAVMESHLQHQPWLACDHLTIADIACYPYVALAPEGAVSLEEYPAVRVWIGRIQQQPGYVDMPGTFHPDA